MRSFSERKQKNKPQKKSFPSSQAHSLPPSLLLLRHSPQVSAQEPEARSTAHPPGEEDLYSDCGSSSSIMDHDLGDIEFDPDHVTELFQSATTLPCFHTQRPLFSLAIRSSPVPAALTSLRASSIPASSNLTDLPNAPRLLSSIVLSLFPTHSTAWDPSSARYRCPDIFPRRCLPRI